MLKMWVVGQKHQHLYYLRAWEKCRMLGPKENYISWIFFLKWSSSDSHLCTGRFESLSQRTPSSPLYGTEVLINIPVGAVNALSLYPSYYWPHCFVLACWQLEEQIHHLFSFIYLFLLLKGLPFIHLFNGLGTSLQHQIPKMNLLKLPTILITSRKLCFNYISYNFFIFSTKPKHLFPSIDTWKCLRQTFWPPIS
jgi:hypothetical protein